MHRFVKIGALAAALGSLVALPFAGAQPASAQSTTWPPVITEMGQLTVGNLSGLLVVVSNRTSNQHAFVDVRVYVPAFAKVATTFAGLENSNAGKVEGLPPDGQQVGWINHFVRAGQAQGPFYVVVDNAGRTFETYSWLWFSSAGPTEKANGNYVSPKIKTDSPLTLPGLNTPAN